MENDRAEMVEQYHVAGGRKKTERKEVGKGRRRGGGLSTCPERARAMAEYLHRLPFFGGQSRVACKVRLG